MAAPLPAPVASTCAVSPAPATWAAVPPEDHDRLNAVVRRWNELVPVLDMAELVLDDANGYVWHIMPLTGVVVTAKNLEDMRELRHVVGVECDMNVRGPRCHGAVCVYVRSAAKDFADGGSASSSADVTPPLGGTSYTQILRATCPAQIDALYRAVRTITQ
jgi:hypothetical protein